MPFYACNLLIIIAGSGPRNLPDHHDFSGRQIAHLDQVDTSRECGRLVRKGSVMMHLATHHVVHPHRLSFGTLHYDASVFHGDADEAVRAPSLVDALGAAFNKVGKQIRIIFRMAKKLIFYSFLNNFYMYIEKNVYLCPLIELKEYKILN